MPNLVELIKKIALDVINESKPIGIFYGTVESISPLKIRIDQKRVFTENFLILCNNVKDYKANITINNIRQECIIHNSLKQNEKVILVRLQGGQKYLVLDRM